MDSQKSKVLNIWIAQVHLGKEKKLGTAGPAMWDKISKLPGFISYKWFKSVDNPQLIVAMSEWETIEDLKRGSQIFQKMEGVEMWTDFQGQPQSFNLIEVASQDYQGFSGQN